ncbi:MAG: hypothetical protein AUJ21_01950 [Anaerolineae bacterium CG1_02_58_13]|nr:MAG: hypothetical protein AUJ21_01950 [Anaerolineae bacterium CG1_02_58_13]
MDQIDQPHPCHFADSLSVHIPFFMAFRNFLWRRISQFGVALIGTRKFLAFQVCRNTRTTRNWQVGKAFIKG